MAAPATIRHLEPTQSAGGLFVQRGLEGSVVMLNLLRFREVADYTAHPELALVSPISGVKAFDQYIQHTLPFLRESGGDVLFLGAGGPVPDRPGGREVGHGDAGSPKQRRVLPRLRQP
jgi:hypothetical protein